MRNVLQNYLERYVAIQADDMDEIMAAFKTMTFGEKEFLLKEGQVAQHQYFIVEGLVRMYYTDEKGHEKITQFALENWWLTAHESYINQTPSKKAIQALETTTVLAIHRDKMEKLLASIPILERFLRIIAEKTLLAAQRRGEWYLSMNSKDRYDDLVQQFPDFVQRIPQYMMASYLEMTPQYLSEIRKK